MNRTSLVDAALVDAAMFVTATVSDIPDQVLREAALPTTRTPRYPGTPFTF